MRAPTPYLDLNLVLERLTERLRSRLGDNLIGVYLQGSFGLGDFDEASDVDLTVVIGEDIPAAGVAALERLHREIYALPSPWAQHLEMSYTPAGPLRRLSSEPRDPPGEPRPDDWRDPGGWRTAPYAYPFWYLNNGATRLIRSEHDNTQVVRWLLRERGIPLFGPSPRTLVDPVGPEALRASIAEVLTAVMAAAEREPGWLGTQMGSNFAPVFFARTLETLATGEIRSKRAAVAFARAELEPRWAQLVEDAFAARRGQPRGPGAAENPYWSRPAESERLALTLELGHWAAAQAAPYWTGPERVGDQGHGQAS